MSASAEEVLRVAAVDRATMTRVAIAIAEVARRHAPVAARRWDALLDVAGACAAGRATLDAVLAARTEALDAAPQLRAACREAGDGSPETRYGTLCVAVTFVATAEADQPSLLGLSSVSCASQLEVCLDHACWALSVAADLVTDALVELGGAFVPEATAAARDGVRERVDAMLADVIRSSMPTRSLATDAP
jgi:hypothetical protein